MLDADHLLGGRALRREVFFQPAEGRGQRRILIAEPLEQLDVAGRRERHARQPAQRCRGNVRAVLVELEQLVGELIGQLPRGTAPHDLLREAAEVVDEKDADADRDRPELADRQRLDLLIRAHHAAQDLGIEAAVGVRDVGPREAHHPRIAGEMAARQLRELAVVARGQVVVDLAELLVDDVEVVDEPLGRRRDRTVLLDRPGEDAVRLEEHAAVLGDAGLDGASAARRRGDRLDGSENLGVLFQPLDAQELLEDRLLQNGL